MAAPYVPPVVDLISAHPGFPSGVAGILLTHLGDNGQTSRTYSSLAVERLFADQTRATAADLTSDLVKAAISDVIGAPSGTTNKRAVPF